MFLSKYVDFAEIAQIGESFESLRVESLFAVAYYLYLMHDEDMRTECFDTLFVFLVRNSSAQNQKLEQSIAEAIVACVSNPPGWKRGYEALKKHELLGTFYGLSSSDPSMQEILDSAAWQMKVFSGDF